jgi:prophage antirepressor-like protein
MTILEFKNTEFQLRSAFVDGEPWFVAKDVCQMLGIQNPSQAVNQLDEDERAMLNIGRQGDANIISESGLYALIFQSRKPEAKAFRRWVTGEVLPQIRETGGYRMRQLDQRRVCEVKAGVEGVKQKLARQLAHLWKVQEVEGNVSLKAYLYAAGVNLTPKQCMSLGARCHYRCKVFGDPVGHIRQKRRRMREEVKGVRAGYQTVATFPPQHITVELRTLGFEHEEPSAEKLEASFASLMPMGHRLNPATPKVSLYLKAA